MKRPSFLSKWAWSVISSDIYINWVSLLSVTSAKYPSLLEDEELGEKGPKWHISLYGLSLRATDPKDHIFGLLGVAQIKIKPNYNEKTSVRDVYLDYFLVWLDDWRTDACRSICELFFLVWSGSAFSRKNSTLSSWTPSFPGLSGLHGLSAIDSGTASHGVFGQEIPSCSIEGSTLFASGLRLETVTVAEETISEGGSGGINFKFLQDLVFRSPGYPTGISTLQALFRLFIRVLCAENEALGISELKIALAFLQYIINKGQDLSTPSDNKTILRLLGLRPCSIKSFTESFTAAFTP
jgi:hypothetical protein